MYCGPPQVSTFALNMYNVAEEHMASRRSGAMTCFKDDVAEHVARAMGARWEGGGVE